METLVVCLKFCFDVCCSIFVATAGNEKPEKQASSASAKEVNVASDKALRATVAAVSVPGKLVGPAVSPGMTTVLELKNSPNLNLTSTTSVQQTCAILPPETWLQVWSNMFVCVS